MYFQKVSGREKEYVFVLSELFVLSPFLDDEKPRHRPTKG